MTAPRLVFLGTPEAAVPSLRRLLASGQVGAVVTRPDRPRGRSGRPQPAPVKAAALEASLPVHEAAKAADLDATWFADATLAVVVAYGVIIPPTILSIPAHGFLNVHFSLLPRWRGASPVSAAIAAGDSETGVTIMQMNEGLDTGPILAARAVVIGRTETAGQLSGRLAEIGANLLALVIPDLLAGRLEGVPQRDETATYAGRLTKGMTRFNPAEDAAAVERRVRSLAPRPGLTYDLGGVSLRLLAVAASGRRFPPGELAIEGERAFLGLQSGSVELLEVQPAGRKAMAVPDWLRGWRRD